MIKIILMMLLVLGIVAVWVLFFYGWHVVKVFKNKLRRKKRG